MTKLRVAFFPYGSDQNPYQNLLKNAIVSNTLSQVQVIEVKNAKWFPYIKIRKEKADLIHHFWPHNLYTGRNKYADILKKISFSISLNFLKNEKLIYSAENLVSHESKNIDLEVKWIQKLINRASGIVFMSNSSKELFLEYYKLPVRCRILVIPHINYINHYPNNVDKIAARKNLLIESNKKVLLSLGRVNPYKGTTQLIESFIRTTIDNSVLLIAGKCTDLDYEKKIKDLIEVAKNKGKQVIFINKFIEDDEIQYYFNAANGVVVNYTDVPLNPGSIVMAMGFGCNIIAPILGAIPEIVPKESFFGYIQDDISSMDLALNNFFCADDIENRGQIAKNRVLINHDPKIIGNTLVNFYNQL